MTQTQPPTQPSFWEAFRKNTKAAVERVLIVLWFVSTILSVILLVVIVLVTPLLVADHLAVTLFGESTVKNPSTLAGIQAGAVGIVTAISGWLLEIILLKSLYDSGWLDWHPMVMRGR